MKTINVIKKETFRKLEENSALTLEGLRLEDLGDYLKWVEQYTKVLDPTFYIITGEDMNKEYKLTGDNAYPEDLHIVCIMLDSLEKPMSLAIPRFSIGARWFDDVVENNRRRERNR